MADVDGDGDDDLFVGASGAESSAGASYLVLGPLYGSWDLGDADAVVFGESSGDISGRALAAGDMDGEGSIDLLIGASYDDEAGTQAGAAFLVYGFSE